jgi:hypothetical protein
MNHISVYMVGFALLLIGVALAALLLGVPLFWVVILVVIVLASAYLVATSRATK